MAVVIVTLIPFFITRYPLSNLFCLIIFSKRILDQKEAEEKLACVCDDNFFSVLCWHACTVGRGQVIHFPSPLTLR